MKFIAPFQSLTKLVNFTNRVERIKKNEYSNNRFLTADINKLTFELRKIPLLCSIGVFNKNKERADQIIKEDKLAFKEAKKIIYERQS